MVIESRLVMGLIERDINEIVSDHYPNSRVVRIGNGSIGNPTVLFIRERRYSGKIDRARFYAEMMPACFVRADVYKDEKYRYSIGTASGYWKERLRELEIALIKVSLRGLNAIRKDIKSEIFGKSYQIQE